MDLAEAVIEALRPHGARERLRGLVARGYSAIQVYERLPAEARALAEAGAPMPEQAPRVGLDRVHRVLTELVRAGRVKKRRESYGIVLNTKGHRGMVVDVYSLP